MSNYKDPQDKKAAYLSRDGKWFKMDKESVRKVCGRPRLRNTAKIAFFGLQPHFHDGDGLFLTPLEHVAQELGTTTDKLSEDIDILVDVGIFRRTQTGLLYDPVSYKLITKNEEPPDAKFCRISQDSAEFGENLQNSLGQIAALDKIRASLGAAIPQAPKRSDLNSDHEEGTKSREGSFEVASRFSSLKMKVIQEVRASNLDLDWSDVCAMFITANDKPDSKLAGMKRNPKGWFETFVVGYRNRKRQGVAAASPGPSESSIPANDEAEAIRVARLPKLNCSRKGNADVWTIGGKEINHKSFGIEQGDFVRLIQNMLPRTPEKAHKYLCELTGGKEWNTQAAYDDFGELFGATENDEWCGVNYEPEEDKAKAAIF